MRSQLVARLPRWWEVQNELLHSQVSVVQSLQLLLLVLNMFQVTRWRQVAVLSRHTTIVHLLSHQSTRHPVTKPSRLHTRL